MFEVIICTVSTGRVQRKTFDTWEAARQHADKTSEKGQRVRVSLERVQTPVLSSLAAQIRLSSNNRRTLSA